jgi:energy-coupling factor transport system permease protein
VVDPAGAAGEREAALPAGRPIDLTRPDALGFFRPGDGWLHALHPWPKLLLLVSTVLAPFVLPAWTIPLLIVAVVVGGLAAGLGRPFVRSVAIGTVAVGGPIVVLNGLIFPGAQDVLVPLGPLAITREGLAFGLAVAGRLVVTLGAATAFLLSTRPDDLAEGLTERGASPRLAFAMLTAVQAIPRLGRSAARVVDGARTRGLGTSGSLRSRFGALRPIVGAIAVGALLDVRDRTLALESRGFSSGSRRTAYRTPRWRPVDAWIARTALALLALLVMIAVFRLAGGLGFS